MLAKHRDNLLGMVNRAATNLRRKSINFHALLTFLGSISRNN